MSDIEILDAQKTDKTSEIAVRHSMEVMGQWANGEVYDAKIFIERGKMKFQEAQDAFFEFGRILIVLKEHMTKSEFEEVVMRDFNIPYRAAQKMVQATVKFCSPELLKSAPKLIALGKSKLFELMSEDSEDLAELADGGTVNGLTLDDVDRMTVSELRAALKETREDVEAARKVAEDKNKKIDTLTEQLTRSRLKAKQIEPETLANELKQVIAAQQVAATAAVFGLRELFEQLVAHGTAHGIDHSPTMVGTLNQIIRDCESVRESFALPREAPIDAVPAWIKDAD